MKNKLTIFTIVLLFFTNWMMAQAPVHPTNTGTIVKVGAGNLTVSWTAFGSSTTYDYETQIDSAGWSGITNTALTNFTIPYASLSIGNVVTWRVRDNNTGVPGLFTNYSFTIGPNPTPTPLNVSTGVSQATASVSWTAFDEGGWGNGNYDVEFNGTDGTYATFVSQSLDQAGTSLALPALAYNTTYYWRVRDTDIDGIGGNGTWFNFSFTTEIATPILTAPANAATGQPTSVNLTWTLTGGTGGVTFDLEYHTGGGFPGTTVVGVSSPYAFSGLLNNTTYSWRIIAKKAGESNKTSATFTFSTVPPPPTLTAPSPANYAVGITVLPAFAWSGVGTTYDFQIDNNSDFSSPVATQSGAGTTFDFLPYVSTTTTVLANGTLYYWRVRQTTAFGTSAWTQREFTTVNAALPIITTLYPSGNTVNISWYPSPYAAGLKYDILLSTNLNMSSYTTPATGLINTNYTITGLIAGTTYYIQIVSYTGTGPYVYYSFSTVNTFTTPGIPNVYLSYPTGGATTYSNPVTVYYYTGTYLSGLQYEVRYSASSSVDGFGMLNSGATSLTLTSNLFANLPLLTAGQTYYWQVRAYDGVTYGTWSSVESFVIYSTTPAAPIVPYPSYPTTGSIVYINPPTFYWYLGTYATGLEFYVEWDDASNFTTPLGNSGWISNLYFTLPSNLTPGSTYYWHVKSRLAAPPNTQSAYSTTQSFDMAATANGGAAQPYPVSPTGGISIGTPLASTELNWTAFSAVTLEYQVRISPYSSTDGFGMLNHPTAVSSTWIPGTTITAGSIPFTLTAGATYYWQVRSRLQATPTVISSWSYVVFFVTDAGSFAIVPMVSSPNNNQPINSTSAILSWRLPIKSETYLTYKVEYSKNKEFTNFEELKDVNESVAKITGLEPNSTYYWRVLSQNNNGSTSNYSDVGSFKTNSSVTAVEEEAVPTSFELSQNYPNPFNPTTRIRYALPQNAFVSIKIYDMLGREVRSLVNNEMVAGNHSVEWSGDDNSGNRVSSGAYIYRITATAQAGQAGNPSAGSGQGFISTKKMIMLK